MDFLMTALRLTHIVSGFIWVGLAVALTFFIVPAATKSGESGLRYLQSFFVNTPIERVFSVVAMLTVLAGILMYIIPGTVSHFSSVGNMVLGTGALFGLLAAGHGGATMGKATKSLSEALQQHFSEKSDTSAVSAIPTLQELLAKLATHVRISTILTLIALIGMASARYL